MIGVAMLTTATATVTITDRQGPTDSATIEAGLRPVPLADGDDLVASTLPSTIEVTSQRRDRLEALVASAPVLGLDHGLELISLPPLLAEQTAGARADSANPGDARGSTSTATTATVTTATSGSIGATSTQAGPTQTASTATPSASTTATPTTTTAPPTTRAPATTTATTAPTTASTSSGGACFQRSFPDDFNGTSVSGDWLVYVTNGAHSPHAIRRAEAVSVANGLLTITAKNDETGTLFSGGLRHLGNQRYGKFAVRVRTDADQTNATSGVVLTWPTSNNQPRDGENNLYETLKAPGSRWPFYSFIHEPFDDRADGVSQKRFVHQADATKWQEVTMEWTPSYIAVTRRGPGNVQVETQRIDETSHDLITDAEHFLSIQLDLFKGSFPDGRQVVMEVDWVEISSYCG